MTTTVILSYVKMYVGTYAKYNNGSIFGEWLTLGDFDNLEDFYTKCKEIHSDEKAPEFMFQDYETPDILKNFVSECGINENIFEVAEMLEGEDAEMLDAYFSIGYDITEENIETAKKKFFGQFSSDKEMAEEYAEQTDLLSSIPENLRYYFDFESYGRDLAFNFQEFNGYYFFN